MFIRKAEISDLDSIFVLLDEFCRDSLREFGVEINRDYIKSAAPTYASTSLVLIQDDKVVGIIAGSIIEIKASGEKVYQEAVWYVLKEYRKYGLLLLKELEKKCREWGCNKVVMISMANSKSAELERLYDRVGYRLLEQHYLKNL